MYTSKCDFFFEFCHWHYSKAAVSSSLHVCMCVCVYLSMFACTYVYIMTWLLLCYVSYPSPPILTHSRLPSPQCPYTHTGIRVPFPALTLPPSHLNPFIVHLPSYTHTQTHTQVCSHLEYLFHPNLSHAPPQGKILSPTKVSLQLKVPCSTTIKPTFRELFVQLIIDPSTPTQKFSNDSSIIIFYCKYSSKLTFSIFFCFCTSRQSVPPLAFAELVRAPLERERGAEYTRTYTHIVEWRMDMYTHRYTHVYT